MVALVQHRSRMILGPQKGDSHSQGFLIKYLPLMRLVIQKVINLPEPVVGDA